MVTFAESLKSHRLAAGLSQAELAKKAGINQATVSRYEEGSREPSWGHVQRIAAALGLGCTEFSEDVSLPAAEPEPVATPKPRAKKGKAGE